MQNVENSMVGRDDHRKRLVEDLTRSYSGEPKVIPIVGMGGIGKTTLANEVYNNACIRSHFDVCAWATVSQQHNVKEIFFSLLRSTKGGTFDMNDEAELANMLQRSLKGKRYLIVLDDMWKSEAWDAVRLRFPSENKGSGILLTTRNTEVARDSEKCHGLPLTIAVVAGLLKTKRAIEDWESVAKDVKSLVTNDPDERCSRVLGLSYNHLTSDLKACLLHLGIFQEDSEIPAKKLMRSWMAEGFLKLENDLEGEAEKCLQELVDRCLVLICKKSRDGTKIRSCKVHDIIYDLCLREIQRGNVFIMNDIVLASMPVTGFFRVLLTPVHRQLRGHDNYDHLKRTRSIFSCHLKYSYYILKSELIHFKLLSVLELRHRVIDNFPPEILSLICLRYLSLLCRENLDIPPEICRFNLPDWPSGSVDKGRHLDFSNLQTISYLPLDCCTKEVIMGIQNVKELGICGYETDSNRIFNNLIHLQQLETLSFIFCFAQFPATLKKLKLEKWHPNVRGFTRLKLLLIEDYFLEYWNATDDNFPVLERLVLNKCHNLKEIPIEFAEIHTLQLIELERCLSELGESAARIQKEQEDLGNDPVDGRISRPCDDDDDDDGGGGGDDDEEYFDAVDVAEDDDDEDSDVDVAKDDDDEDFDADAAEHDD
ncbi:hypothetical protein CQW23_07024 [Capsicum baccatum]|uniref:NB-ARC domain-containing protein n=1 Tax=Capsicum baccatum TaxID=33114 RepID=A0A2G2X4Z7_CAPBA|nr:hypothetical protein CQW23_07024 [Capsicum baccatum]